MALSMQQSMNKSVWHGLHFWQLCLGSTLHDLVRHCNNNAAIRTMDPEYGFDSSSTSAMPPRRGEDCLPSNRLAIGCTTSGTLAIRSSSELPQARGILPGAAPPGEHEWPHDDAVTLHESRRLAPSPRLARRSRDSSADRLTGIARVRLPRIQKGSQVVTQQISNH
jgi:hypothetical protein